MVAVEEECDCNYAYLKTNKKKLGSDLLGSHSTEGTPLRFISSLVKAERGEV